MLKMTAASRVMAGSGAEARTKINCRCTPKGLVYPIMVSLFLLLSTFASAQSITGKVTNGTTGNPSVGDDVALLSLAQGMQEIASTKSDASGHFSLPAPADQRTPNMVRVTHQGVNYFPPGGPLMPGTRTADITVYDAAKKVEGLSQTVEVDRYQADGNQLQAIVLFAFKNDSKPPRAVGGNSTFEFVLPNGAEIEQAYAKGPGGQPVATAATPTGQKNYYSFSFPLRPGETQFQVAYQMPYSGEASFSPKPLGEIQHFVVMTPKGMKFEAKDTAQYQSMPDDSGASVMVVTNVKRGQDLSFRISGTGVFENEQQSAQGGREGGGPTGGGQSAANDNRPGGGLGAPIADAPDPLHDYRAYILGAFALVLVMGGAYVVSKSNQRPRFAAGSGGVAEVSVSMEGRRAEPVAATLRDRSGVLLEAMKEELFQLEIDRTQGKLTTQEYEKAKAALDETIRRALARVGSS